MGNKDLGKDKWQQACPQWSKAQARACTNCDTGGSQISLLDTISSSKLAGKHELVQGILLGEKTESQPNLRTKATDLEAWETVSEEEVSAHPPAKG